MNLRLFLVILLLHFEFGELPEEKKGLRAHHRMLRRPEGGTWVRLRRTVTDSS